MNATLIVAGLFVAGAAFGPFLTAAGLAVLSFNLVRALVRYPFHAAACARLDRMRAEGRGTGPNKVIWIG